MSFQTSKNRVFEILTIKNKNLFYFKFNLNNFIKAIVCRAYKTNNLVH